VVAWLCMVLRLLLCEGGRRLQHEATFNAFFAMLARVFPIHIWSGCGVGAAESTP